MLTNAIDDGCLEAIAFGMKDALLRSDDYATLAQCTTLEDIKSLLTALDYGTALQTEASVTVLTSQTIYTGALKHIVQAFEQLRENAVPPLSTFLDFISFQYMIENVLKLISGVKHGKGSAAELLCRCHPLGNFPSMSVLTGQTTIEDMYNIVLIDSPISRFFTRTSEKDFDELSIEYIRATLMKNWYEQFHDFCESVGGPTCQVMCPILAFEADRFAITITLNSRDVKDLGEEDRKRLYPKVGELTDLHDAMSLCESEDELRDCLRPFPEYAAMVNPSGGDDVEMTPVGQGTHSIERRFLQAAITLHKWSLSQQFHYGVFYSWLKLKEQEAANILWLCECVTQGMGHRATDYVSAY